MVFLSLVISLAAAPFVLGQTNNTQLGIQAIEAHFTNAGLVPSFLATFDPSALFTLDFAGVSGDISPGEPLTQTQVAPTPSLVVTPANSTVATSGNFTLAMVDAGPVGTDESQPQTRHWLVNGVTLTGSSAPFNVSTAGGLAVTDYAGPAPASGSGAHRYVIMLYEQPSTFTAPSGLNTANVGVSTFDFSSYVKSSGLGPLVAAIYFTVEVGTATSSVSATSPVITSTLPAATATSASASSSGTTSGSSAPSPSSNSNGSQTSKVFSIHLIVAACIVGFFLA